MTTNDSNDEIDALSDKLRHMRKQVAHCTDATDKKRRAVRDEIHAFLAEIDAFTRWRAAHDADLAEGYELLDQARSTDDMERKSALIEEALRKGKRRNARLIDFMVNSGYWKIRPPTLEQ